MEKAKNSFEQYQVTVSVPELNVRKRAGKQSDIVGLIYQGDVHTITDEKDGWGKISTGWICLEYIQKTN